MIGLYASLALVAALFFVGLLLRVDAGYRRRREARRKRQRRGGWVL